MTDESGSGEDVLLLCLRTVDANQTNMQQLESAGITVHEYDNVDECIQHILSINPDDAFVMAWLGFGWNYLIPILNDFEHVPYLYLSEPSTEESLQKVHGVFNDTGELFQRVLVDARACQLNHSTHLNILDNQETSTIQNQRR